jgi:metal-responsive CopG/Arc/MetJ family transcriptional regulator
MLIRMTKVAKVTVSLPAELLTRIEEVRFRDGTSRSETVTALLWRGWRQAEDEARADRYRAAYVAQPETADELAFAEAAAGELFGPGEARGGISAAR